MKTSTVIFCDFDGTITQRDMILTVCEKFCPPEWVQIKDDIVARKITVKQGIVDLFNMIPSSQKQEIVNYAQSIVRWRDGFSEFLDFCQKEQIAFTVCSGGLDFFIEPLLAPFRSRIQTIYSIPTDFSQPRIQLRLPHACPSCSLCKAEVMSGFPASVRKILIGDGVTDVHGAQKADCVFARNGLMKYLDEDGIRYTAFETFHDIQKGIADELCTAR